VSHKLKCPGCGSYDITTSLCKTYVGYITYDAKEPYNEVIHDCNTCNLCGDFNNSNSRRVENALKKARRKAIKYLISTLQHVCHINIVTIERICGLQIGESNNSDSAALLTLLALIHDKPDILETLEHNQQLYSPTYE
jgi:hypothetical protein